MTSHAKVAVRLKRGALFAYQTRLALQLQMVIFWKLMYIMCLLVQSRPVKADVRLAILQIVV